MQVHKYYFTKTTFELTKSYINFMRLPCNFKDVKKAHTGLNINRMGIYFFLRKRLRDDALAKWRRINQRRRTKLSIRSRFSIFLSLLSDHNFFVSNNIKTCGKAVGGGLGINIRPNSHALKVIDVDTPSILAIAIRPYRINTRA